MQSSDRSALVVSVMVSVRLMITLVLTGQGIENVAEAADDSQAKEILASRKIDVLIYDKEYGDQSGLPLLQWIRSQPQFNRICFVLVISKEDWTGKNYIASRGASAIVMKPFSRQALIDAIQNNCPS